MDDQMMTAYVGMCNAFAIRRDHPVRVRPVISPTLTRAVLEGKGRIPLLNKEVAYSKEGHPLLEDVLFVYNELSSVLGSEMESSHWSLYSLRPKERKVVYYDSLRNDHSDRLIHGMPANVWGKAVMDALYRRDVGKEAEGGEWEIENAEVANQDNGSDCGFYVCDYMKRILFAYPINASEPSPAGRDGLRKRVLWELLNGRLRTPQPE